MASMTSSVGSISPMTSPMEPEEAKAWEPQQQLNSYVAWVNSQIRKKHGTHPIEDLRNDMRDGVVFADIIEIVSNQRIADINGCPSTYEEMRHNIDQVLQFMVRNEIKMHRINPRDIVEGNLKAIMRLILALAAHYRPMSVRHSGTSSAGSRSSRKNHQSVMDIAQGASAALTEARRNAKKAGKRQHRSRHDKRYQESSSEACSDSDQNYLRPSWRLASSSLPQERRELEGCSAGTSPVSSCRVSPRTSLHFSGGSPILERPSDAAAGQDGDTASLDSGVHGSFDESQVQAVKAMKKQLLQLQDVILANSPDSAADVSSEPSTPEGVMLLRSQLQHSALVNADLREELLRMKNDCLQLQGTKAGLNQRLSEQDALVSQLKSEKLNLEIELQTVSAENMSLRKELNDQVEAVKNELKQEVQSREHTITSLRRELMKRDQMIDKLQEELKHIGQSKPEPRRPLTQTVPTNQQEKLQTTPKVLQNPNMTEVGDRIRLFDSPNGNSSQVVNAQQMAAEVSMLQDSLSDMQTLLSGPGVQAPPLDRLERSIITMLQNLRASRHPGHPDTAKPALLHDTADGRKNADNKSSIPRLKQQSGHTPKRGGRVGGRGGGSVNSVVTRPRVGGQAGDGPSTCVIYFTDHSIQPNTCLAPGRLGQIRLKDFKNLFEDCDKYRYYFKALDPEYGTVKEELTKDEAVVPGWENKIVAWVETESGTPC